MKYILGVGFLSAIVLYFTGIYAEEFSQDYTERTVSDIYASFSDDVMTPLDFDPATGKAGNNFRVTRKKNETITYELMSDQHSAMKIDIHFEPILDGKGTRVKGSVETYDVPGDLRPPSLQSAGQLAYMLDQMLETTAAQKKARKRLNPNRAMKAAMLVADINVNPEKYMRQQLEFENLGKESKADRIARQEQDREDRINKAAALGVAPSDL